MGFFQTIITTATPTNLTGIIQGNGSSVTVSTTLPNTSITGLGTASTHATTDFAQTANNLSDLANKNTALNNLAPAQTANSGKYLTTDATNTSWKTASAPMSPTFALAIGTAAIVGTNLTNILVAPRAGTITKAFAVAKTGPTGAALIFDILLNGTTIWSTTANRLQIADGSTSGTQTSFDTTAVNSGDQLTINIAQIGSSVAGQDITVELYILATI